MSGYAFRPRQMPTGVDGRTHLTSEVGVTLRVGILLSPARNVALKES